MLRFIVPMCCVCSVIVRKRKRMPWRKRMRKRKRTRKRKYEGDEKEGSQDRNQAKV